MRSSYRRQVPIRDIQAPGRVAAHKNKRDRIVFVVFVVCVLVTSHAL
jgi:hypothetical protein